MRGRSQPQRCYYCGGLYPIDTMSRSFKRRFSYFDDRAGISYAGPSETIYVCPKCGRRRHVRDMRPHRGRPKKR
ncbi:hypothetical protein HYS54_01910 [Candidatus Micrarchaeota archaeon]|nr:hypothetical protein [Candidatus Micrarchaeota archaeon]